MYRILTADTWREKSSTGVTVNISIDSSTNKGLIACSQWTRDSWFEWQQHTPNGKFPTISSRSWAGRRANIDRTLRVALESPQQMFFFSRFHCPVYFKLLRHSLEVKGPRTQRVLWERRERNREGGWFFLWPLGQRAAEANEEGAGSHVRLLVHPELLLWVKV